MEGGRHWWLLIPEPLRRVPADLAATAILCLITVTVVVVPVLNETPLRVVFGLSFVLFLPGYAFIAALFPEAGDPPTEHDEEEESRLRDRGIDGIERVALSFGLSIAIVPLLGLVLNFTPWGITLIPILLSVAGFTLVCLAIATYRRWELPVDDRFQVPYRDWVEQARAEVFEPDDQVDAALNVALALSVILAVGVLGYAVIFPPDGEQYSEFYILGEDEDGEYVAANYPTEWVVGNTEEIVTGVGNQEHETVEYTIIVQLQEVEFDRDADENTTNVSVVESEEIERLEWTLAHNETRLEHLELGTENAEMIGEDRRLQFLLYADHEAPVPDEPTLDNAYRDLHLWVNVSAG